MESKEVYKQYTLSEPLSFYKKEMISRGTSGGALAR